MLEVRDLTKEFKVHVKAAGLRGSLRSLFFREWKKVVALDKINLKVNEGEIVGVLGSNGAGKTTLIKILSGIVYPSSGEARVLDYIPYKKENAFRSQIALVMGQKAQLWWDLPAGDCFLLLKQIYQIPSQAYKERLAELSETLDVCHVLNVPLRKLSLGERMKMEIIAALLHQPKVVFLDEPTIGLDIGAQRAIRQFILEYRKKHSPIILVTSHYMDDIKALCKRVLILRKGKLVYDGKLSEVQSKFSVYKIIVIQFKNEEELKAFSVPHEWGKVIEKERDQLKLKVERDQANKVTQLILNQGGDFNLRIEEQSLDEVIDLVQKG